MDLLFYVIPSWYNIHAHVHCRMISKLLNQLCMYHLELYLMKYFIFRICEGVTNETLEWRPYDKCHRCQKHQQPSKQQNQTRCTEITNELSHIERCGHHTVQSV